MEGDVTMTTFVVSLISAALGAGGIGALLKTWIGRRGVEIRGELQIVDSVLGHNETLRSDVDRLSSKFYQMDQMIAELRRENVQLHLQHQNLCAECARLEQTVSSLREANHLLQQRCTALEVERDRLKEQVHSVEDGPEPEDSAPETP